MLKRRWHAAGAALVSATVACAAAAQSITWQTGWRVGDSVRYDVTQERIDERQGRPSARRLVASTLTVRALPRTGTPTGYRLGWRRVVENPASLLPPGLGDRAPALVSFLRQPPEVVLLTDADGMPESVESIDGLTTEAKRAAAELGQAANSEPAVAAMIQEIVSPAVVRASLLFEGNVLLGYAGVEFKPGDKLEVPQQLPNPLGGPAFDAVTRVRLVEYDPKAQLLRIEAQTTLDPEKARAVLEQTIERLSQRLGRTLPPGTYQRVDIRTLHTVDVDLRDGWPTRATTKREIEIVASDGVGRRTDSSLYVRKR